MLIGAHVSIAGGIDKAIDNGELIGAEAIQTFASSPRSIRGMKLPEEAVLTAYREKRAKSKILYHVFHGVYLINLAYAGDDYVKVCVEVLKKYQTLAAKIGVAGTCFHLGSHKGSGLASKFNQIVQAISEILKEMPPGVDLMLENTAGQKGTIGESFEELSTIMEAVAATGTDTTHLTLALDTQHAFAAGYNWETDESLEAMLQKIDQEIGLTKLALIHLNDSAIPFATHKDRHANIGEGFIGKKAITLMLNHPKLNQVPFILEVPGKDKEGPGKDDLKFTKSLIKKL